MGASVHKIVHKIELAGGRVIKFTVDPNRDGWVLVEGAQKVTVIQRFEIYGHDGSLCDPGDANDSLRVSIEQNVVAKKTEISVDRERGGKWWRPFDLPRLVFHFMDLSGFTGKKPHLKVTTMGGDLKMPIEIGMVDLLPPAKTREGTKK